MAFKQPFIEWINQLINKKTWKNKYLILIENRICTLKNMCVSRLWVVVFFIIIHYILIYNYARSFNLVEIVSSLRQYFLDNFMPFDDINSKNKNSPFLKMHKVLVYPNEKLHSKQMIFALQKIFWRPSLIFFDYSHINLNKKISVLHI